MAGTVSCTPKIDDKTETPGGTDIVTSEGTTEETTEPEGTTPGETSTPEETTTPTETSTPEETQTVEETSTPTETTVPEETSTPEETQPVEETSTPTETTPEETSTPTETTVPEETSKPVDTTCKHNYITTVVPASCLIGGYTEHTCTLCKDTYTDSATKALGHNFVKGSVVSPTTSAQGYTVYTCSRCGITEKKDYVDKLVDNSYTDRVVAPTCTTKGYTERRYNADGRVEKINEVPALGHSYTSKVTAPTCTAKGYTTHTCSRCKNTYTDCEVKALGHDFVKGEIISPTTSAGGYTEYVCSRCNTVEKRDYTDKLVDPNANYKDTVVAPTCTERGYTRRVYNDGNTEIFGYVDALGHNYVKTKTVAPGCTQDGYDLCTCSRCGSTVQNNLKDKLGHKYEGAWIVETPATATADGNEYQLCSRCGGKQYRVIPKSGGEAKTDVYTFQHCEAGKISGECNYYSAEDRNPICIMAVYDYSLKATVVHTGYLAFKVTFVDNTGTTQVIDIRYEYDNPVILKAYSCRTLEIQADGSYEISYGGRLS